MSQRALTAIKNALTVFPGLRVGQLIHNATHGADIFYTTDEDLALMIEDFIKAHGAPNAGA